MPINYTVLYILLLTNQFTEASHPLLLGDGSSESTSIPDGQNNSMTLSSVSDPHLADQPAADTTRVGDLLLLYIVSSV